MTLNARGYSYNNAVPGAVRLTSPSRLEGPERGLDALVGLVILLAELTIGLLAISALFDFGTAAALTTTSGDEQLQAGFAIAVFVGGAVVVVTTIVYLARVVIGRRSWPAPLWGTVLMSIAFVIGYAIMAD